MTEGASIGGWDYGGRSHWWTGHNGRCDWRRCRGPTPAVVRAGKMAAAAVKSIGGGLGVRLRELRIHLCQRSSSSRGVRSARGWAGPGPGVLLQGSETPRPEPQGPLVLSLRREFIEQHYVTLKKANPDFPILIRECSGIQPKLWARYGK